MITQIAPTHNITDNWDNIRKIPKHFVQLREALVGADLDSTNLYPRFQVPITFGVTGSTVTTAPITVDQNVNGISIDIDSEATSVDVVNVAATVLTSGNVFDVPDADALTSGSIMNLVSNSSDTTARSLVKIVNDHASATGTDALYVRQDSTSAAVVVDMVGDGSVFLFTGTYASYLTTTSPTSGSAAPLVTPAAYLDITYDGNTAGKIAIFDA